MPKLLLRVMSCLIFLSTDVFAAERPPEKDGWNLVWQDEFNGKELSPKSWNVLLREHSKHNERQYYVPDEAYIENDCL